MLISHHRGSLFFLRGALVLALFAWGCSGGEGGDGPPGPVVVDSGACLGCSSDAGPPPPPPPRDSGTCTPRMCLPGECDVVDNGCGGTMHCGSCACEPRTCEEAGVRCGTTDDGCGRGGTIDCNFPGCPEGSRCEANVCVCDPDMSEPNEDQEGASDLGQMTEGDSTTYVELTARNLHTAADQDWFTFRVVETFDADNPEVIAQVNGTGGDAFDAEVSVFFICDAGGETHSCLGGLPYVEGTNHGCLGAAGTPVRLTVDCSGIDDVGQAVVRVRHPEGGAGSCDIYTIGLSAE